MRQRALNSTLHDTGIRHIDGADDYRFNYHPNYFEIIKGGIILYVYIIIFNNFDVRVRVRKIIYGEQNAAK